MADYLVPTIIDTGLSASQGIMTNADKRLISVDYFDQAVKVSSLPSFAGLKLTGMLEVHAEGEQQFNSENQIFLLTRSNSSTAANVLCVGKSRGIVGAEADIEVDDNMGSFGFSAWDTDGYYNSVAINATCDGVPVGSKPVPSRFSFYTTDAAGSILERLRIDKAGLAHFLYNVEIDGTTTCNNIVAAGETRCTGSLNVIGTTKLGDSTTNYHGISAAGITTLVGNARVYRHLDFAPKRFKMPAANFPAEGQEGLFQTLDFDKTTNESAYCQDHVPFGWDDTTDIEIVIDWLHDGEDAGTVCWGIEYKAIKAGEAVVGAGTTITKVSAGNHTAGQLVRTTFTLKMLASNLENDDDIAIRLFRDTSEDALDEDARFVEAHFQFIINKFGQSLI